MLLVLCVFRSYPVYVGDYTSNGQQYYTTTSGNFSTNSSSSNGNSYVVPVDDTSLLVSQSRGSPHSINSVSSIHYLLIIIISHLYLFKDVIV